MMLTTSHSLAPLILVGSKEALTLVGSKEGTCPPDFGREHLPPLRVQEFPSSNSQLNNWNSKGLPRPRIQGHIS